MRTCFVYIGFFCYRRNYIIEGIKPKDSPIDTRATEQLEDLSVLSVKENIFTVISAYNQNKEKESSVSAMTSGLGRHIR